MDKYYNKNIGKGKYGSNLLLLIVLIGFCILAIIEILYGQAQIRLEKERLALEEENYRTVQELKSGWDNLAGDVSVSERPTQSVSEQQTDVTGTVSTHINTEDNNSGSVPEQSMESEQQADDDKEYDMQIVVMGDSIMADEREDNRDVPTLIGEAINAKVYNMAIGGTTAALIPGEQYNYAQWSSQGFLGVVNAILGNLNPDIFEGYATEQILRECDFSKTDYFVIEYGLNDFLTRKIPQSRYLEDGGILDIDASHTYAGALDVGVSVLAQAFPDAKILLVSPHYCQFYEDGIYVGDAYSVNYGYGTLVNFFRITGNVAEQHREENVLFFNAMEQGGIDAYTADKFLIDGTHLSNEGKRLYADKIAERINADFYRAE